MWFKNLIIVYSIEQIRTSKGYQTTARVFGAIAIALVIITLTLDRCLGYRIGPSNYVLFLWLGPLQLASIVAVFLALLFGFAARQWFSVALTMLSMVSLLLFSSLVRSGPNPEAWCYNNLRKIDAAKNELAEKNNLTNGTFVTGEQISPYIEGGYSSLECAEHGTYIINPIGTEPRCTFHKSMSEMEAKWKKASH